MTRASGVMSKSGNGIHPNHPPHQADICIISECALEFSTELVMDWLASMGATALRLNGESLGEDRISLEISNDTVSTLWPEEIGAAPAGGIRVVWYRRWNNTKRYMPAILGDGVTWESKMRVAQGIRGEIRTLRQLLLHLFANAHWLGHPKFNDAIDKLTMLKLARENGLDIPATFVSSDREELRRFAARHSQVITKSMSEGLFIVKANPDVQWGFDVVTTYTTIVPGPVLNDLKDNFFPVMLQECLHKQYEIRCFFVDGEIYSTAIFSQADSETTTDYHRYQYRKPARLVPYRLPAVVEERVRSLMNAVQLNIGSIDFVRTIDGRTVFLEVNPNGQFSAYSLACNYYLEKKIAEALLRKRNYAGKQ